MLSIKKFSNIWSLLYILIAAIMLSACNSGGNTGTSSGAAPSLTSSNLDGDPSSSKDILTYAINGTVGIIDQGAGTISVTLPYGTALTNLTAVFSTNGMAVRVGDITQVSGVSVNNFTTQVIYTVVAEDQSIRNYTVTVTTAASSAKEITSYLIGSASGIINGSNINVQVPYGTDLTSLVAVFSTNGMAVRVGAITQVSGFSVNNFTNPVSYTVYAEDGSTQTYVVTVTYK